MTEEQNKPIEIYFCVILVVSKELRFGLPLVRYEKFPIFLNNIPLRCIKMANLRIVILFQFRVIFSKQQSRKSLLSKQKMDTFLLYICKGLPEIFLSSIHFPKSEQMSKHQNLAGGGDDLFLVESRTFQHSQYIYEDQFFKYPLVNYRVPKV